MRTNGPIGLEQRPATVNPIPLYLCSFLLVGMSISLLGPALPQLRLRAGVDIGAIGLLFVGQSIGYVSGSVVGGRLYDRFDGHRVFAASLFVVASGLVMLATLQTLALLTFASAVIGLGAAAADLGVNVLLMWHLGGGVGRWMNVLHLAFGVGALSAPLLVHLGLTAVTLSAPVVCVAFAVWAISIPSPIVQPHDKGETVQRNSLVALVVSASFFVLYVGLEVGFSGWIFTYAEELNFSDFAATWLTTVFWVGFTFGRVLSSIFAGWFTPKAILRFASSLTVVAAVLLLVGDGDVTMIWLSTGLMGLAMAPQFPVMLTFLERRISMTGRATSWFVGGSGLGLLLAPWLIGQWLDRTGVVALPRAMVVLGVMTFGAFVASGRVLGEPRAERGISQKSETSA